MSDVRVSLRRFHRGPNNSSHPFRNAYKSRDSVATEGNQGAAKRLAGGGKGWDGAKRETKGFDRAALLQDERRDDVENCSCTRARPSPLLPWKGLFFIIQNIQSFKLWKTAAVIRIIGPLYSPRIRSVTNNGFSKFNSPRWSRIGNWLRFEKEKMFWKQSKFDDKVRRWRRKVKILIFNRIGWFWTYGDFLKSCFPSKR